MIPVVLIPITIARFDATHLPAFFSGPTTQALAYALIHSVWQGLLVAMLLWLMLRLLDGGASRLRYTVSCLALALMLGWPLLTFAELAASTREGPAVATVSRIERDAPGPGLATEAERSPSFDHESQSIADSAPVVLHPPGLLEAARAYLVPAWCAGVLFFLLRLAGGWGYAAYRVRSVGRLAPLAWRQRLKGLQQRMGLGRSVRLLFSSRAEGPYVFGWFHPVIVFPASVIAGLLPWQVEAILAHELAHIKRYDFLTGTLQAVAEALLFYHPAVWWVSAQIRAEREHCCDDLAAAVTTGPLPYARALAELEGFRSNLMHPALAASGGDLMQRIHRLLGPSRRPSTSEACALTGATLLLLAGWLVVSSNTRSLAQEPAGLPMPAEEVRVELDSLTLLDDAGIHVLGFRDEPEEQLILPDVDRSGAQYLSVFYSRAIADDYTISVLLVPDSTGEWLYVDFNNDEDLTNDGPPAYFARQDPEFVFWLTPPNDPDQRAVRVLQRVPYSVRANPEMRTWFDNMHDEEGNLNPRMAMMFDTEGKKGTFYFDDRIDLRRGHVRFDSTDLAIGIYDYDANGRFNDEDDLLLVDLDGDKRLTFIQSDSLIFKLHDVVEISERRYRLSYVDPYGQELRLVEVDDAPTQHYLDEVQERMARAEIPVRKEGTLDSTFWATDLETLSGDPLHLDAYRGQHILLNIWGEWCAPCVAELPTLVDARAQFPDEQLAIIGLLKAFDVDIARAALDKHHVEWPQSLLPDALRERFDVWSYPTNILILPDGETYLEVGHINEVFLRTHVE